MTTEEIKGLVADIARGNKELQASQRYTDTKMAEMSAEIKKLAAEHRKTEAAQQKTEIAHQKTAAAQQKTEIALQELAAEHQKTEAALQELAAEHQKTEAAQQKTEIALQELAAEHQKTEAALQELAAEHQKTEAAQRETEIALQELAAEHRKTEAAQQKTEIARQETEIALQKTAAAQQETEATLQKIAKEYGAFINNQGLQSEDFFIKGLQKRNLKIGDIQFDEILPRQEHQRGKRGVEIDALLTNGEYVALLEVKTKVHVNDVETVFHRRIPAFRNFFSDYRDKSLLVLIGGNIFNDDALAKARAYGFICLTPDNQDLHIEAADFRKY